MHAIRITLFAATLALTIGAWGCGSPAEETPEPASEPAPLFFPSAGGGFTAGASSIPGPEATCDSVFLFSA